MKSLFVLFFGALLASSPAFALGGSEKRGYVGAGVFSMNAYKVAGTSSGTLSPLGRIFIPVSVAYKTSLWMPTLRFTPLGVSDLDGSSSNRIVELAFPFLMGDTFKIGPGLFGYWMKGASGALTLGNGGSTSPFYRPNRSAFSTNWSVIVGLGKDLGTVRWDLDMVVTSALSTRRAFNLASTLSFPLF